MPYYTTDYSDLVRTLIRQRMESEVGIRLGDRRLKLWGSDFDIRAVQNLKGRLHGWAINQRMLPAFELTESNLRSWCDLVDTFRPYVFEAYADTLVLMARLIIRESRRIASPPSVLIAAAEGIGEDERTMVERAFGAPVLGRYGTRELGNVAHECTERGLHIAEDRYVVEVLDENGRPCEPGREGRLVISDLTNPAFPLIRYDVGDMGVLTQADDKCPCGSAFRRLERITGRSGDAVVLPDGRNVTRIFFPHLFKEVACIEQWKIIQERVDYLRVLVRAERELDASEQSFLLRQFARYLPGVDCVIERHAVLPVGRSGKHRLIENRIGKPPSA